uniref:Uncharacterized protein n=1 Tax=Trypanosoma vivax (strain Y486) TaxID=1055687 RepID=G0TS54_TRYVY|nr:hypothetical protein TVY486_0201920 [Trypanosoma vivax Y486]
MPHTADTHKFLPAKGSSVPGTLPRAPPPLRGSRLDEYTCSFVPSGLSCSFVPSGLSCSSLASASTVLSCCSMNPWRAFSFASFADATAAAHLSSCSCVKAMKRDTLPLRGGVFFTSRSAAVLLRISASAALSPFSHAPLPRNGNKMCGLQAVLLQGSLMSGQREVTEWGSQNARWASLLNAGYQHENKQFRSTRTHKRQLVKGERHLQQVQV